MKKPDRPTWVLVADRGGARLCATDAEDWSDLRVVEEFAHPEARARMHRTVADRAPRITTMAARRTTIEPHTDFAHDTAQEFSRELLARLEAGRHAGEFGALVVAAPPLFLGVLRAGMSLALKRATAADHDLDLTGFDLREIRARLGPAIKQ